MAPYYDKAEGFIGVTGTKEGLRTAPDGNFLPPAAPRVHEVLVQKSCDKLNIPCIPSRLAVLTRSINKRPACHYCGQCGRGCLTASNYDAAQVQIFPALKSGRLQIINNAMARELMTDDTGKVAAVSYIDKATRTEKQVRCRAVVLAASACESARLLLNSKGAAAHERARELVGRGRPLSHRQHRLLARGAHSSARGHAAARRRRHGRHARVRPVVGTRQQEQGLSARAITSRSAAATACPTSVRSTATANSTRATASSSRRQSATEYGTFVGLAGRGEMVPNEKSYMEIDPKVVDQYGIPVLRFHFGLERIRDQPDQAHAPHVHGDPHHHGRKRAGPRRRRLDRGLDGRRDHPRARAPFAWATIRRPRRSTAIARRTT